MKLLLLILITLFPVLAFAHDGHNGGGFFAGINHPVLGLDHFLAMVSVGILSAKIGGKALWTIPATFVGVMLFGGILGMMNVPMFSVEVGIAFSVFALGAALAAGRSVPTLISIAFVAAFAIFHGHAHGAEMPEVAKPALYAIGFVLGTAGIHLLGVLIGIGFLQVSKGPQLLRVAGVAIASTGLHFLIG